MSEQAHERKEHYKRVRTEFDDLDTEDKVLFLMEATVSTIARGVDEFGRAVSDELNKAFSRRAERREKKEESSTKGSTSTKSKSTKTGTSTKSKSTGSKPTGNGSEDKDEGTI